MNFTDGTALTTAVTDLITGLALIPMIIALAKMKAADAKKKRRWTYLLILLSFSSVFGFVAHGFEMTRRTYLTLWIFLYIPLYEAAKMFLFCALPEASRKKDTALFLTVTGAEAVCYALSAFAPFEALKSIYVFIFFAVAAVLPAFVILLIKTMKRRAGKYLLAALVPQLIGLPFQLTRSFSFKLIFELDYNGIYHLCLLPTVLFLYLGARELVSVKAEVSYSPQCGKESSL